MNSIDTETYPVTPFPTLTTKEDLKREIDKSLAWKGGRVRGVSLKTDTLGAIKLIAGTDTPEKIQEILTELSVDIDLKSFESYSWYPAGYGPVLYLAAAHLFSWGPEEIIELGRVSTRGSILIKLIMRFASVKATLYGGSAAWHKYYDFGDLVPVEYSEENSYIQFKITDYDVHPINEFFHSGYFKGVIELVTGSDSVKVLLPKSIYRGDEYSEYKVSW